MKPNFCDSKNQSDKIEGKRKMLKFNKKTIKGISLSIGIVMIALLANTSLFSGPKTPIGDDVSAIQLIPIPIDDFEKDTPEARWKVIATPYDPNSINSYADIKYVDGRPADLGDLPAKKVMGIKFQFRYPGYNFITLFPPELRNPDGSPRLEAKSQEKVGPAIEMPGRTRKISIWVMSQGKDYVLEGYIKDWRGDTHRLIFGSLKYVGWRPLSANVPTNVPQAVGSYPQTKTLKFIKFIIRSTRKTSTEPVFLFFDQLKILTNKFDVHFDGAEIDTNWGGKLSPVKNMLQATKPPR